MPPGSAAGGSHIIRAVAKRAARAAGLVAASVAVGAFVASERGRRLDAELFVAANRNRGPAADSVFSAITELGSIWASIGAATVLVARGHRSAAVRGLAAASTAWLAGQGLKRVFLRPRPYLADRDGTRLLIGEPRGASWPSSHPAVLLAFATAAGRTARLGRGPRTALAGLAAAVGASRTYLGVHYPGDVAGGLLLGRAIGGIFCGDRR